MYPIIADADNWGGLIFVAIMVIVAVIGAIRNAIKQAKEKSPRRAQGAERKPAPKARSWEVARSELEEFLSTVKEAAQQTSGEPQVPPPPQPPPAARPTMPRMRPVTRPMARPILRPVPLQPARRRVKAPEEVVILQPAREEPEPVAKPAAATWFERLPKDRLKRAIVLREVLGPPVSRLRKRGARQFGRYL